MLATPAQTITNGDTHCSISGRLRKGRTGGDLTQRSDSARCPTIAKADIPIGRRRLGGPTGRRSERHWCVRRGRRFAAGRVFSAFAASQDIPCPKRTHRRSVWLVLRVTPRIDLIHVNAAISASALVDARWNWYRCRQQGPPSGHCIEASEILAGQATARRNPQPADLRDRDDRTSLEVRLVDPTAALQLVGSLTVPRKGSRSGGRGIYCRVGQ